MNKYMTPTAYVRAYLTFYNVFDLSA